MARPSGSIQDWATDANFSAGPESGNPTKDAPTIGETGQGLVPGSPFPSQHVNYALNNHYDWLEWLRLEITNAIDDTTAGIGTDNYIRNLLRESARSNYGDGSDGNVTITGGTTTLTRDMYYDNLTITGTGILMPVGYRVFVRGTLQVQSGGTITAAGANGAPASGTSVGSFANNGSYQGDGAQSGGGQLGAGNAGTGRLDSIGGSGGAGGSGSSGANAGGAGGAATPPNPTDGGYRHIGAHLGYVMDRPGAAPLFLRAGGGGGGGAGDGFNRGGAGGGGAGGLVIMCFELDNSGTIDASGGNGGNGQALFACGGGGGGGGGFVFLGYRRLTALGTVDVAGGTGGLGGAAGGAAGGAGAAGSIVTVRL